jgi:signal transduction histidine kinase
VQSGPVDLVAVARESAAAMRQVFADRRVGLDTEIDVVAAATAGDHDRLVQVLINLLGNAVKFTDSGTIRLHVYVSAEDNFINFDVEDTGRGIAPEHLDRVFDSFWQADQAPSRRAGGVGLGLHVTRQLVRLLGGEVTVRSSVGRGSCFNVRLPKFWWGSTTAEFLRMTPTAVDALRRSGERPAVVG